MEAALLIVPNPLMRDGLEAGVRDTGAARVTGSYGSVEEALGAGAQATVAIVHDDALESPRRNCAELGRVCGAELVVLAREIEAERAVACLRGGARAIVLEDEGRLELVAALKTVIRGGAQVESRLLRRLVDLSFNGRGAGDELGPRERRILELLAAGLTSAQIGERLDLAPKTVRNICTGIYSKLGARSRPEAIATAVTVGAIGTDAV